MTTLIDVFPNPDDLARLPPQDVAPIILRLAREFRPRPQHIHVTDITHQVHGPPPHDKGYPQNKKPAAERAINIAWNWLERQGLLIPAGDVNGQNGWRDLSDDAERIAAGADMQSFIDAAAFPKELLHSTIRDDVWDELARGDYDDAVLKSMRAVEEAVRQASGIDGVDGVRLMRAAFDPNGGPLIDKAEHAAEREALSHLFVGAIGYYKNPQSHRTVKIDGAVAREVAIIASNLLRIVDARRPKGKP
jgi:uncharacterized protein (TIGR02391 family)